MELEVRHLRCLDTVATAGSITKAAREVGLSQPALTAQVRRIEQVLGGPVFERGRFGVHPTPLGDVLLPYVREVLGALADLDGAVRRHRATPGARRLRVGARSMPLASRFCEVVTEVFPGTVADLSVVDRCTVAVDALARGNSISCSTWISPVGRPYRLPACG